jgi:hypothetical protein
MLAFAAIEDNKSLAPINNAALQEHAPTEQLLVPPAPQMPAFRPCPKQRRKPKTDMKAPGGVAPKIDAVEEVVSSSNIHRSDSPKSGALPADEETSFSSRQSNERRVEESESPAQVREVLDANGDPLLTEGVKIPFNMESPIEIRSSPVALELELEAAVALAIAAMEERHVQETEELAAELRAQHGLVTTTHFFASFKSFHPRNLVTGNDHRSGMAQESDAKDDCSHRSETLGRGFPVFFLHTNT